MPNLEQLILAALADGTPHSLIALRSKLNVDVEHFVSAIARLEGLPSSTPNRLFAIFQNIYLNKISHLTLSV